MNQLVVKSLSTIDNEEVLGAQSNSDIDDVLFIGGEPKAYASYYEQKNGISLFPDEGHRLAKFGLC